MKHSISEQIKAIQDLRAWMGKSSYDSVLNDIGSTLAALNLTKDLPEKEEYFEMIYREFNNYVSVPDQEIEQQIQEKILLMTFDTIKEREARIGEKDERIKELEEALNKIESLLKHELPNRHPRR